MDACVPAVGRHRIAGKRSAIKPRRLHARLVGGQSLTSDMLTPPEARPLLLLAAWPQRAFRIADGSAGRPARFVTPEALKYSTWGRQMAFLLDTACRVDFALTHSKQTIGVPLTRHKNQGVSAPLGEGFSARKMTVGGSSNRFQETRAVRDLGTEVFGDGLAHVGKSRAGAEIHAARQGGLYASIGTYSRE